MFCNCPPSASNTRHIWGYYSSSDVQPRQFSICFQMPSVHEKERLRFNTYSRVLTCLNLCVISNFFPRAIVPFAPIIDCCQVSYIFYLLYILDDVISFKSCICQKLYYSPYTIEFSQQLTSQTTFTLHCIVFRKYLNFQLTQVQRKSHN